MWLLIHLISFILLALVTLIGLTRHNKKQIVPWLMADRVLYILILISGGVLIFGAFKYAPVIMTIKGLLGLAVIALIEIAFARKQERKLSPILAWCLAIVIIVTACLGLWLVYGH
ncbi:YisL family protein [Secundilactobacillus folii]|uniref:DUF1516 family protein n=1 Tax=Secundilactobacillus folii TaxID=2678357 RepID=A0A7X2XVP7_9LACO|nr:YisL family protein [Secundilactobacillus folii]MTV82552.1 DUF1516 family protein [Secundilactobacillus folii]